ncbi:MAG TPA: hypothetical protein VG457_18935 [Planctomycetota bacterium]|jgi:hypothetical protein|nr:hypothetical protein [Planctomycetota bacterium]
MTVSVRLPKHQTPIFPALCVGCGADNPAHSVTLWTWSLGWWAFFTLLAVFWSKTAKATAPACRPCAWRLRFRRLASVAYFAVVVAVGIYGATHYLQKLPRLLIRLFAVAGCAVLMIPYAVLETNYPPSLSIDVDRDQVTYEFRDPDLAIEFSDLNNGRIGELS